MVKMIPKEKVFYSHNFGPIKKGRWKNQTVYQTGERPSKALACHQLELDHVLQVASDARIRSHKLHNEDRMFGAKGLSFARI